MGPIYMTLTFELGLGFYTVLLTAKFQVIILRVIVQKLSCWQTNERIDLTENMHVTALRYVIGPTPVEKDYARR